MFEGRQRGRGEGENPTVMLKRSDGVDCSVTVRGKQGNQSDVLLSGIVSCIIDIRIEQNKKELEIQVENTHPHPRDVDIKIGRI